MYNDAIIIMCKVTALEQALSNSKNIIGDNTMLMSFQNGIGHEEIMQKIAGKEKVLGGSTTQASSIQATQQFKPRKLCLHGLVMMKVVQAIE